MTRAVFFGLGSDGTVSSNKASIKIIGEATPLRCQGYFVLRLEEGGRDDGVAPAVRARPIRSTYQIRQAEFVARARPGLPRPPRRARAGRAGATVLLNLPGRRRTRCGTSLPRRGAGGSSSRSGCRLFVDRRVPGRRRARPRASDQHDHADLLLRARATCCPLDDGDRARSSSRWPTTWGKRGPEIVRRNVDAIDAAARPSCTRSRSPRPPTPTASRRPAVPDDAPDFVQRVTRLLLEGHGDRLPVSAFPPDGTWPTGTSRYEKRAIALEIPIWEPDLCVQCNRCSMICPHTAIRHQGVRTRRTATARPTSFRQVPEGYTPELEGLVLHGAGRARRLHRLRALRRGLPGQGPHAAQAQGHQHAAGRRAPRPRARGVRLLPRRSPTCPARRIPRTRSRTLALLPACSSSPAPVPAVARRPTSGLLTQLFGDRLVIANATGCSSIYGGNLPTTPVHDRRRRARPGVEQLAVRGQRRVRPRAAPRRSTPPTDAPGHSSSDCAPELPDDARRRAATRAR